MSAEISAEELEILLDATQSAATAWMQGDAEPYLQLSSRSEDYTIMGPFGGPTTRGFGAYGHRAPTVVRNFANGASKLHLVESYSSGDILVLVLEEEQFGEVGEPPAQSWSLRVTQVYRREQRGWRVVHRHADPLVRMRTTAEAAALARD